MNGRFSPVAYGSEGFASLAETVRVTRRRYHERLTGQDSSAPWWTAVVLTASSRLQAERYEAEIRSRVSTGCIPSGVQYLVVPDPDDQRVGSGGATLNALRHLMDHAAFGGMLDRESELIRWWSENRVLLIHSGGDSRRLPQYSLTGKLFAAVPLNTPSGQVSTVFDETLALSTAWADHLPAGLVVGSGDVILTFDASSLTWDRPGICGVAMLQAAELGTRHGVYIASESGLIYRFLQKPSMTDLRAAGGLIRGEEVALDTGLIRFDPTAAARLVRIAGLPEVEGMLTRKPRIPGTSPTADHKAVFIDLYAHLTMSLTGQWKPGPTDHPALHELAEGLRGIPFWCSLVAGDFTHIGTTYLFRELMTRVTEFSRLHAAHPQSGVSMQKGVKSGGFVIDSALSAGAELGG